MYFYLVLEPILSWLHETSQAVFTIMFSEYLSGELDGSFFLKFVKNSPTKTFVPEAF